jgi:hypothetical protein
MLMFISAYFLASLHFILVMLQWWQLVDKRIYYCLQDLIYDLYANHLTRGLTLEPNLKLNLKIVSNMGLKLTPP